MSWWAALLGWGGWAVAVAGWLALRRRLAAVADAEHELRGAATAIGLVGGRSLDPVVQLQVERMQAALWELAQARGSRPPRRPDLDAGRLAQVLGNVAANAAEHGVGPVEVSARRERGGVRLELRNRERPSGGERAAGRGRGLLIARRAARGLGGGVTVERAGGFTRTVVELPAGLAAEPDGDPSAGGPGDQPGAAPGDPPADRRAGEPGDQPGAGPGDDRRAA